MADELGVVHGTVGLWESGQRNIPGPALVLIEMYERELGYGPKNDSLETLTHLKTSWFSRSLKLSSLSTQFAARFIWNHLQGVLKKSAAQDDIQFKTHRAVSLKIASTFGKLKGLPMKLGQMVSYMNFTAPDLETPELVGLQHMSPPMDGALIAEIIVKEFKQTPNQLFKKWTPQPFAAASIGQVHRAELQDATAVAVKVQYPKIKQIIECDLKTAGMIDQLGSLLFSGQEEGHWISELRERLTDECDYKKEVRHLLEFYALYQNHPHVRIPKVFEDYSSAHVITTELLLGMPFDRWKLEATQEQRNKSGETIFEFSLGSVLKHGLFNGDPHPGNYLFEADTVSFLDFGCVKRVEPRLISLWGRFIKALLDDDSKRAKEILIEFQIVPDIDKFDFDTHYKAVKHWYHPLICRENFHFHPEFMTKSWKLMVEDNPNLRVMNVPKEWILVNHMHWGVYAILSHLKAGANWFKKIEEFLPQ